jgi:2-polyprenyl-3-methyl-5-hydroxy-6-metoxy-1,4-benzoquinol methylase
MTKRCHVCRREGGRHIFQSLLEKYTQAMGRTGGVDYHYCNHCSGLFQDPVFDESEYQKFYEQVQRSDQTGFSSEKVPKKYLEKKRLHTEFKWRQMALINVEAMLPGKRVFEIGPAEGTLLASFRDRGYSVRGIEPLATYASHARDVLKLDVADGYFDATVAGREKADLVILDNVLEHLMMPYDMLRLVRSMISANGILYVAVPNAETASPENANISHITLWTRRALAFTLSCAGFQPLAILQGRPADRPHEWVSVSQACLQPRDIEHEEPVLYPASSFDEIAERWQDMLGRYAQAAARAQKYGPAYTMLVRSARRARSLLRRLV